jgi:TatD DNase family protein
MIDSHCHLDGKDYRGRLDQIVSSAQTEGVHTIVNIGADLPSSIRSIELAKQFPCIFATVGVHPHDAKTYSSELEEKLQKLLSYEKVVAIGEIGLDFFRDLSPRNVQREIFRRQLEMAADQKFPVVIHTRDAFRDTINIVKEYSSKLVGGIFHCFLGSVDEAKEVIELGFYISIGGIVTFPKSVMTEMAVAIPLEYILLETDSPYLAPVPYRGKINQPAYIKYVKDKVAQLRNIPAEEVEKITDRSCRKAYRLEDPFGG